MKPRRQPVKERRTVAREHRVDERGHLRGGKGDDDVGREREHRPRAPRDGHLEGTVHGRVSLRNISDPALALPEYDIVIEVPGCKNNADVICFSEKIQAVGRTTGSFLSL